MSLTWNAGGHALLALKQQVAGNGATPLPLRLSKSAQAELRSVPARDERVTIRLATPVATFAISMLG